MKRFFKNVLFIKCSLTLLLFWLCYVPEIRLDMKSIYVQQGKLLSTTYPRSGTYLFNGKRIFGSMDLFGCNLGFIYSYELAQIADGKNLLELVFVRNLGHSLSRCDLVIEIRKDGVPLKGYSQKEMLEKMNSFSRQYKGSIIIFLIWLPIIWFPKIFSYITRG